MPDVPTCPLVPVSWGELLDKITILQIKADRIGDAAALDNVRRELARLEEIAAPIRGTDAVRPLLARLKSLNQQLWAIEDAIRECDRAGEFGQRFVELARSVYRTNDARAACKRELNDALGSDLVEEKSYASLTGAGAPR